MVPTAFVNRLFWFLVCAACFVAFSNEIHRSAVRGWARVPACPGWCAHKSRAASNVQCCTALSQRPNPSKSLIYLRVSLHLRAYPVVALTSEWNTRMAPAPKTEGRGRSEENLEHSHLRGCRSMYARSLPKPRKGGTRGCVFVRPMPKTEKKQQPQTEVLRAFPSHAPSQTSPTSQQASKSCTNRINRAVSGELTLCFEMVCECCFVE